MKILILGGTGMLGHSLYHELSKREDLKVYATVRDSDNLGKLFAPGLQKKILHGISADNSDSLIRAFAQIRPDVVINCIGLIKQLDIDSDPLSAIFINSLFPHRVSAICKSAGSRFIHISTDCVFDGVNGNYKESDVSNARDLYGRSKSLGEVGDSHCITLRTSIIGHELRGKLGLVEWFLSQKERVQGYTRAIYSGFPTVELAGIISKYVLTNQDLAGLYQVSSDPISKYDLLCLIAEKYGKQIKIEPYEQFVIDRSLDSSRFREKTGYVPPKWPALVDMMHQNYIELKNVYFNQPVFEQR